MDINQYLEIFVEESQEHLQSLNQSLLGLESNPNDMKLLNEIFRVAHTIKGMAGTMGYTSMMNLTHEMENVLDAIRNEKIKVNSHIIDILFKCLDYLEGSINMISNHGKEDNSNIEHLKSELIALLKDEERIITNIKNSNGFEDFTFNQYDEELTRKAIAQGMRVYKLKVVLSEGCMLKSARAFIVFNTIEKHGEIFKSFPKVEDIEDEKFDREFKLAIIVTEKKEIIQKDIESISEIEEVIFEEVKKVEESTHSSDEVSITDAEYKEESVEEEKENYQEIPNKISRMGKTVRVDIDRLDNLMNLVSELIIIKTRLEGIDIESKDQNMTEAVEYLERITTSLHDAVMKVRMVPIERVFNRFPRMVRDLSRELNKEIILNMTGEETELDRTVIDEIGDPLIHLIRNSIDHGIENREDRIKNNKPVVGTVLLKAYQDGNNVVIEVQDDGEGIDIESVKNKSVERGLIKKSKVDELSDKDVIDLLFNPGFSTADEISDISGRGVGLDVVKTKIESLGGTVEVETNIKVGSKFIIRLPLTLAIIQALLVNIGEEKYAITLNSIREIISVKTDIIKRIQGEEVILHRNAVLPIVRLDKALDIYNSDKEKKEEITVVVVKKGEKNSGFIVDNLIGQQEIVIKSLGKYLSGLKIIAGATILGDGQVALIIDTGSLI